MHLVKKRPQINPKDQAAERKAEEVIIAMVAVFTVVAVAAAAAAAVSLYAGLISLTR